MDHPNSVLVSLLAAGVGGRKGVRRLVTQCSKADLHASKSIPQRRERGCFKEIIPKKQ